MGIDRSEEMTQNLDSLTVFVGGLAPYTSAEDVLPIFGDMAQYVERCRIAGKIHSAFVTFSCEEDLQNAMNVCGESCELDGRTLRIELQNAQDESSERKQTSRQDRQDPEHTLYVGNLEPHTTREDILPFLTQHAEVVRCRIVGRIHAAFVSFNSAEDVKRVLLATQQPNGCEWNGRDLIIQRPKSDTGNDHVQPQETRPPRQQVVRANPRQTVSPSEFTLYIGGLPPYTTEDAVMPIFGEMADEAVRCRIAGRIHAAFVTFSSEADMLNACAIAQQPGVLIGDCTPTVEVQKSSSKSEREEMQRTNDQAAAAIRSRPATSRAVRPTTAYTLYVGGLAPYTSEEQVLPLFGEHAEVQNCRIAGRIHAAFVSFANEEDMLRALAVTQLPGGNELDGRELRVEVQNAQNDDQ